MHTVCETLPAPKLDARPCGARRISMLTDDALFQACGVRIAFTGRDGGSSQGPFASLNLGAHVQDNLDHVMENRARVMEAKAFRSSCPTRCTAPKSSSFTPPMPPASLQRSNVHKPLPMLSWSPRPTWRPCCASPIARPSSRCRPRGASPWPMRGGAGWSAASRLRASSA